MLASDLPTDPLLSVPSGLRVTGTNATPQQQISIVNGVMSAHRALIVTFSNAGQCLVHRVIGPAIRRLEAIREGLAGCVHAHGLRRTAGGQLSMSQMSRGMACRKDSHPCLQVDRPSRPDP